MPATNPSSRFTVAIAELPPGYFALVMATGAVSIACQILGMRVAALSLLVINVVAYTILAILTIFRIISYASRIAADLGDHARGPGFFTSVAGTCVLGTQLLLVGGVRGAAEWLWLAGLLLWFIVMYSFFTAVVVRRRKPDLAAGINGAWLIATVSTQSVAILAALLGDPLGLTRELVAFGAVVFFLIGCMLYLAIITLIFYRLTFLEVESASLTPPYWINMGAVAITTLSGATLILRMADNPLISTIMPFLKGFTLFFWAAATWWIPALLLFGLWRHVWKRFPLSYDLQYWGMIFPLGMYTIATWNLADALGVPFVKVIPRGFIYLAIVGWAATFLGMVVSWFSPPRDSAA